MTPEKLTVLVAGLGRIGMGYDLDLDPREQVLSHARAFSEHHAFELTAGVDRDQGRREMFERRYQRAAYRSIKDALAAQPVDVVAVAVPTASHVDAIAEVLAEAHPQAILCEKPFASSYREAEAAVALCGQHGVPVYVNYMRRAVPGFIEVKNRLAAGRIVTPVKGVVWCSKGLVHNGSHFVNLLLHWLGPLRAVDRLPPAAAEQLDADPDVRVRFERGTVVFLSAREEDFSHYTVELVARNGRLRVDDGGGEIRWQRAAASAHLPGYVVLDKPGEYLESGMRHSQWHVADQLAKVLRGLPADLCSGQEALRTRDALEHMTRR